MSRERSVRFLETQNIVSRPWLSAVALLLMAGTAAADDWSPLWSVTYLSQGRTLLAAASVGDKVYIGGGSTDWCLDPSSVVDVYDTSAGTWSVASLSQARYELVAASAGGKVLFGGGLSDPYFGYSNVVDILDTSTGTQTTANLSIPRCYLTATSLGSKVFFAGSSSASPVVDIYDTSTSTWSTASLSQGRAAPSAASAGNKAFFAGGMTAGGTVSGVVDIYDASAGAWSVASLSQPRSGIAAASAGNMALFAGGSTDNAMSGVVDICDASTGVWSTASLSQARDGIGAASVGTKVLFAGGALDWSSLTYTSTVDIYDTSTGLWSATSLSQPRACVAAASAGNKVLFAGGYVNGTTLASNVVDIYTLQSYPTITSTQNFTLQDNTTVAGLMQLNGGSLGLGAFNLAVGSMGGTAPIDLGSGTLTTGSDNTSTSYDGPLSGGGSLVKVGSGTLTLTASNTHTGTTTINAGTMALTGPFANNIAHSPTITVNSGATLDVTGLSGGGITLASGQTLAGNGTVAGGVVAGNGSTIAPGTTSTVGTLSVGSLTLNPGATLNYKFGLGNDLINVASPNGLTINGGGVNLYCQGTPFAFATPGTYTLMNYPGGIGGSGALSVLHQQANTAYNIAASGGSVKLTIGPFTPPQCPVINPVSPPPALANNSYVVGIQPSFQWTPLTVSLDAQLAVPGLVAFDFAPSYSIPAFSPSIPALPLPFTVPSGLLAQTLASAAPQTWGPLSLSATVGATVSASGEATVTLQDNKSFAAVDANLGISAGGYVKVPLPGVISQVSKQLAQFLPDPVKVDVPVPGLPDLDTGTVDVPIPLFQYDNYVVSLGVSTSYAGMKLIGDNKVPMLFDPTDKTVTVSIGASLSGSAETSATVGVSAWLKSAASGTMLPASAPLAATVVPVNVAQSPQYPSPTGTVQVASNSSITLTTGSPVWLTTVVTSAAPVGAVLLDAQFNASDTSDSMLSVYLAGSLVGLVDETQAGSNPVTYLLPLDAPLPAGTYQLSYRLDPLGGSPSSVVILDSNLVSTPEPSTLALLLAASLGLAGMALHRRCRATKR
jgi:autotransporter-associated beta strand protein